MPIVKNELNQKKASLTLEEAQLTLDYFKNAVKNGDTITPDTMAEGIKDMNNLLKEVQRLVVDK